MATITPIIHKAMGRHRLFRGSFAVSSSSSVYVLVLLCCILREGAGVAINNAACAGSSGVMSNVFMYINGGKTYATNIATVDPNTDHTTTISGVTQAMASVDSTIKIVTLT